MIDEFVVAACVPRAAHASGIVEAADAILAAQPDLATADMCTAGLLGDAQTIRCLLADDAGRATARAGCYGWDPLTYLCFSRYLRDCASAGFVRAGGGAARRRRRSQHRLL